MNNLGFYSMSMGALILSNYLDASSSSVTIRNGLAVVDPQATSQCPYADLSRGLGTHTAPVAIGTIHDETLFVPNDHCGPMSLDFDVTPFFDGHKEPLTYALSSVFIEGQASQLTITLDPFTGVLEIPVGWFGVNTTIHLHIIAKNPYGSASQNMRVFLEPCGG
jgi:hypothetical protein